MAQSSFLTDLELRELGLNSCGAAVKISRKVSIYNGEYMSIGDNVRVDDFCILSGNIKVGSNVHIAAYCGLFGGGGIVLDDFCNLSSRVSIYSVSDDFSGSTLTNPTIPSKYKNLESARVSIGRHVVLGAGAVVLPGVTIGEGCAIGALSLVQRSLEPWGIYAGIPVRKLKNRRRDLLTLEVEYLQDVGRGTK